MLIDFLTPEDMYPEIMAMSIEKAQNWGLFMSHISEAQKHTKGEGVLVAVLDTGVASHPCLDGAIFGDKVNFTDSQTVLDQQGHGCVMPGDKVWTDKHGITEIANVYNQTVPDSIVISQKESTVVKFIGSENINTISYVENGMFEKRKILAVHEIDYVGEIYEIDTGHDKLRLTPWHPVYCVSSRRGDKLTVTRKRADQISIGDYILCSGSFANNDENAKIPFGTQHECCYCGYVPKRGLGLRPQCKSCNKTNWKKTRTHLIELNTDLAFWLGLVISDGHLMLSSKTISFCGNNEQLVELFESLSFKLFGTQCKRNINSGTACHETRLHSTDVVSMLFEYFGIKQGHKSLTVEVPSLISKSNLEIIGAFCAGLIEGDGHIDGNWRIRLCTGSENFASGLSVLLRTFGVSSFVTTMNSSSGFGNGNNYFHVRISPFNEMTSILRFKKGTGCPRPKARKSRTVKSISIIQYSGKLYDFTVDDSHNYTANSHIVSNTHVAGIIAAREIDDNGVIGVAPEARIMSVKVLNDSARGNYGWIEQGIHHAISNGADIINLSLGSPQPPPPSLYAAIQEAAAKGIIVISASGNDAAAVNYPARYDEVIAVAAIDQQGNMAHFSSHDSAVDVSAPGVGIYSTSLNNGYAVLNGTSQAAPFVAGVCALLLSHSRNTAGVEQIKGYLKMLEALDSVCDPKGRAGHIGKDGDIGFGIPDFANVNWK